MSVNTDFKSVLADLNNLRVEELRQRWRTQFGRAAPENLWRSLLLRVFMYRLQTEVLGDLSPGTVQLLESAASGKTVEGPDHDTNETRAGRLRRGTVLVREHGGVHHQVMAVEGGFVWNGNTYKSLSKVAEAISGTKWNGPRFFGLRAKNAEVRQ